MSDEKPPQADLDALRAREPQYVFKNDLLNDVQLAKFVTKVGDLLGDRTVVEISIVDAGKHPDTGEHLTQVSLKLA